MDVVTREEILVQCSRDSVAHAVDGRKPFRILGPSRRVPVKRVGNEG